MIDLGVVVYALISTLKRLRQVDHEFKVSLSYTASSYLKNN
jgi:hypothetical protein